MTTTCCRQIEQLVRRGLRLCMFDNESETGYHESFRLSECVQRVPHVRNNFVAGEPQSGDLTQLALKRVSQFVEISGIPKSDHCSEAHFAPVFSGF